MKGGCGQAVVEVYVGSDRRSDDWNPRVMLPIISVEYSSWCESIPLSALSRALHVYQEMIPLDAESRLRRSCTPIGAESFDPQYFSDHAALPALRLSTLTLDISAAFNTNPLLPRLCNTSSSRRPFTTPTTPPPHPTMSTALRVPNGDPSLSLHLHPQPMTLTVLGCGTLGIAILSGILDALSNAHSTSPSPAYPDSGTATPTTDESPSSSQTPLRTPTNFVACVRRPESAKRIRKAVSDFSERYPVEVLQNRNVEGVQKADVVILGCKPYMVADILREEGIKDALSGKLLISICAGVPVSQIEGVLYPNGVKSETNVCRVVRVMPNTAAIVRESMTVIATSTPPLPKELEQLVEYIFTRIGRVVHLPASTMDVSTALCGSGPAFLALMLESLADGAVAMGLPRAEAQLMAAQTMRGTAGMVLSGDHPALIREKVSTPGGCTIGGLLVLEEGVVRGTVARAVREATVVAGELGKGGVGVNGTRGFAR